MAGYSGTPLVRKLGLREGMRVHFRHPPEEYLESLVPLPTSVEIRRALRGSFDFLQAFYSKRSALEAELPRLRQRLLDDGMLWISWPKKSSGVESDVDEHVVRAAGLAAGLVDTKKIAVDEVWSGLKFVVRKVDRR